MDEERDIGRVGVAVADKTLASWRPEDSGLKDPAATGWLRKEAGWLGVNSYTSAATS